MPGNGIELVEQWADVHGVAARRYREEAVDGHAHRVYTDAEGRDVVEVYWVRGLGHGTPIDPPMPGTGATEPDQCGIAADYVLPAGICASYHIARFWGLAPR